VQQKIQIYFIFKPSKIYHETLIDGFERGIRALHDILESLTAIEIELKRNLTLLDRNFDDVRDVEKSMMK